MERLQKFIASSGICSRRKAEELIVQGKVKVNGIVVNTLGTKVSFEDDVNVDGKTIKYEKKVYYMLNKPRGVISSVQDEKDRQTVVDLIAENRRIFPVGRLDYDTTGLIFLTNDGELANILMHPKNEIEKIYVAKVEGKVEMDTFFNLKKGIKIAKKLVIPTTLKIKSYDRKTNTSIVKIGVIEGMNHLVKNIFQEIKHPVIKLKREEYGGINLGKLKSGEYRHLNEEEIEALYNQVNLKKK